MAASAKKQEKPRTTTPGESKGPSKEAGETDEKKANIQPGTDTPAQKPTSYKGEGVKSRAPRYHVQALNFPISISDSQIYFFFKNYKPIAGSVNKTMERDDKVVCFVSFASKTSAELAVEKLNNKNFYGATISLSVVLGK